MKELNKVLSNFMQKKQQEGCFETLLNDFGRFKPN